MRWHADLRAKSAAQVKLVETGMTGEMVQPDRVTEARADVVQRAPHGTRVVGVRAADNGQRTDGLGNGDLERETIGAGVHGIDEAVKRRRAFIVDLELRDRHRPAFAVDPEHVVRRQDHGRVGRRSAMREGT